jgi:hypothetical protein
VPSTLLRGPEGELRHPDLDDTSLKYEVYVSSSPEPPLTPLGLEDRTRYLQLPQALPARVAELGRSWTQGLTAPLDKAEAITRQLQRENRYDLASPSGAAEQPLDHFLFESHRGHCEYFSTALAVLLRAVDVPTRNVTGFVAGTYNRFGRFYAVRQGDAHSWVEAWVEGRGWVTLDPTPAADSLPAEALGGFWNSARDFLEAASQRWDRHVVGYDLGQQHSLYEWATSGFRQGKRPRLNPPDKELSWRWPALTLLGLGVGLTLYLRRRRGSLSALPAREAHQRQALELYAQLEAAMRRQGLERAAGTPPLRHAQSIRATGHPLGQELLELTQSYLEIRFGRRELREGEKRELERRILAVARFEGSRSTPREQLARA